MNDSAKWGAEKAAVGCCMLDLSDLFAARASGLGNRGRVEDPTIRQLCFRSAPMPTSARSTVDNTARSLTTQYGRFKQHKRLWTFLLCCLLVWHKGE